MRYLPAFALLALVPGMQWALAQGPLAQGSLAQGQGPAAEGATSPRSQVVRRILPSSVRVQVLSGTEVRRSASGVVVRAENARAGGGSRSLVLTNAHVVEPGSLQDVSYRVLVERRGRVERVLPAKLVAVGSVPDVDLALVSVEVSLPAAELGSEELVEVGDDVVAVGAPYGRSLSVSGGMVSQLEAEDGEPGSPLRYRAMKTDAAIGYGSSGGGVFSVPGGRLIGLVEGYRTARVAISEGLGFDVPMPGETFVAPITKIRRFIDLHTTSTGEAVAQTAEKEKPSDGASASVPSKAAAP